jgi:hypothetical protein
MSDYDELPDDTPPRHPPQWMTLTQLEQSRIWPFSRSTFKRYRKEFADFPQGLKEAGQWLYDASEFGPWFYRRREAQLAAERKRLWQEYEAKMRELEPARMAAQQATKAAVYQRLLAWLDAHPDFVARLHPEDRFFHSDRVFDTLPPDDWQPSVLVVSAASGGAWWEAWVSVSAIMARPVADPPYVLDRTFGGVLPA